MRIDGRDESPKPSGLGAISGIDYGRSLKQGQQPAQTTVVASSSSSGGGGGGHQPRLDKKSEEVMQFLTDIVTRSISDESIQKEKAILEERLRSAQSTALQATYMSFAGDSQSAATLLQQTGEEIKNYKYLIGMIEQDPEGYKQSKVANLFAQAAQGGQGAASIATAMYLPEAYDTQRYGYNVQASLARSGGGGGYAAPSNDVDDRAAVELISLLMPTMKKNDQKSLTSYLLQRFLNFDIGGK